MKNAGLKHLITASTWVFLGLILVQCNATNNTSSLEPLPYPTEQPSHTPHAYFLDDDSLIAFTPRLILSFRDTDPQGQYTMEMRLEISVENRSSQDYTFTPDRATIYSPYSEPSIATVGLDPVGTTTLTTTVEHNSSGLLKYVNDPIDGDILYYPDDAEFFAVFAIDVNGNEEVFTTQVTGPG